MNIFVRISLNVAMEITHTDEDLATWSARFAGLVWVVGDANTLEGDVYDPVAETFSHVTNADKYPLADYKSMSVEAINLECTRQIIEVAGWTIEKQSSFANGIYTNSVAKLQYQQDTMASLEVANIAQDAIDAAPDHAAVDAAMLAAVWPSFPVPV